MTLTISIIIFLAVIVGTLALLTWKGLVSGESLLFFLGTILLISFDVAGTN